MVSRLALLIRIYLTRIAKNFDSDRKVDLSIILANRTKISSRSARSNTELIFETWEVKKMDLGNGVNKEQRLQRTKSEAEEIVYCLIVFGGRLRDG